MPYPRVSFLRVSRAIYEEAKLVLYTVNDISMFILERGRDREGYKIAFGYTHWIPGCEARSGYIHKPSKEMLKHFRHWQIRIEESTDFEDTTISEALFISETNIVPRVPQSPARKRNGLLATMEKACDILKQSHQIHKLAVEVICDHQEHPPPSVEKLLDPFKRLRNIRMTSFYVISCGEYTILPRTLVGPSYERYMSRIMALPEGTAAPEPSDEDIVEDDNSTALFKASLDYDADGNPIYDKGEVPEPETSFNMNTDLLEDSDSDSGSDSSTFHEF